MKNIEDFKLAMIVGSQWHTDYAPKHHGTAGAVIDLGIRDCTIANSVAFALGSPSCRHWPDKSTFSVSGNVVTIDEIFSRLVYTLQD